MATPLDITALEPFQGVFPFIFVLVFSYAILTNTEFFKDKQIFAAIISFTLAFATLFSPLVSKTIAMMMPWMVLFLIFITLLILVFMTLGVQNKDIVELLKSGNFSIGIWALAVFLAIMGGSFLTVWEQESGGVASLYNETSPGITGGGWGFFPTIFHPKVLGLALVLLIAVFTVKYMTSTD